MRKFNKYSGGQSASHNTHTMQHTPRATDQAIQGKWLRHCRWTPMLNRAAPAAAHVDGRAVEGAPPAIRCKAAQIVSGCQPEGMGAGDGPGVLRGVGAQEHVPEMASQMSASCLVHRADGGERQRTFLSPHACAHMHSGSSERAGGASDAQHGLCSGCWS